MKIRIILALAGLLVAIATGAAGAAGPAACGVAGKSLAEFLENLEAKDAADLQACAGASNFCVLTEQGVVAGASRQELKGKGASASAALIQFQDGRQSICLAAANPGGGAAGWAFDGWQAEGDKLTQLRRFAYTRVEAAKVGAEDLAAVMQRSYARNVKGAP